MGTAYTWEANANPHAPQANPCHRAPSGCLASARFKITLTNPEASSARGAHTTMRTCGVHAYPYLTSLAKGVTLTVRRLETT